MNDDPDAPVDLRVFDAAGRQVRQGESTRARTAAALAVDLRLTFPPGSTGHARVPAAPSFSAASRSYGDREGGGSLSEDQEDFAHLREEIERLDDEILTLPRPTDGGRRLAAEANWNARSRSGTNRARTGCCSGSGKPRWSMGWTLTGSNASYRDIMDMSAARQQAYLSARDTVPLRIGYQGVEGAYSHLAAQRRYAQRPGGAHLTGFKTFHEVFAAVGDGRIDVAPAHREHHRRQHQRNVRPARRERPHHHGRSGEPDRTFSAGSSRCLTAGGMVISSSPGAAAVLAVPARSARSGDPRGVRHRGIGAQGA
ncbi:MAG: hypothetical protein R3E12_16045 [Candidatus Eisenbacteria bacterium]